MQDKEYGKIKFKYRIKLALIYMQIRISIAMGLGLLLVTENILLKIKIYAKEYKIEKKTWNNQSKESQR